MPRGRPNGEPKPEPTLDDVFQASAKTIAKQGRALTYNVKRFQDGEDTSGELIDALKADHNRLVKALNKLAATHQQMAS